MKRILTAVVAIALVPTFSMAAGSAKSGKSKAPVAAPATAAAEESASGEVAATATGPKTKFRLRPSIGYALVSPKAVNSELSTFATANGITNTYKISGGLNFAAAADYEVMEAFLLGARIEYFTASTDPVTYKNGATTGTLQASVSGVPVYATATVNQEVATRIWLGVTAGVGVPAMYRATYDISGSNNPTVLVNGTPTYASNPFSAMGLAYANFGLGSRVALRLEGGYRYLTSSAMRLTESYGTGAAKLDEGSLLQDSNKKNLTVDSSALFGSAGVSIAL